MNEKLKKYLEEIASRTYWGEDDEDFCVYGYSNSNVDDAFYGGKCAGEIELARFILSKLNK